MCKIVKEKFEAMQDAIAEYADAEIAEAGRVHESIQIARGYPDLDAQIMLVGDLKNLSDIDLNIMIVDLRRAFLDIQES